MLTLNITIHMSSSDSPHCSVLALNTDVLTAAGSFPGKYHATAPLLERNKLSVHLWWLIKCQDNANDERVKTQTCSVLTDLMSFVCFTSLYEQLQSHKQGCTHISQFLSLPLRFMGSYIQYEKKIHLVVFFPLPSHI